MTKSKKKFDLQHHDQLCRCFIGMHLGREVVVRLKDASILSGSVTLSQGNYFIGGDKLNGKLVVSVSPK